MDNDQQHAIMALQEKVAYQEITIEQLNSAIASQQQQITRLSEELRLSMQLMQQWREAHQGDDNRVMHEIPPHY